MSASIPRSLRGIRACKMCGLIKTMDQFFNEGCDNCENFLHLRGDRDQILDCTSENFDGMIAMMDPEDSWVARWQQIDNFVKGMYAISVSGDLPENIKRTLRTRGIHYKSKDKAIK
ncbi:transcription elongation factor SPT4 [Brachionus plicatilis]|uniref:Transcription elongation factor SPT4 n=1 Tax=Brachionus plicatilis TaxID=10195 RepID=A0A3M7RGB3_BRAPC|nr:transcription elongation factor SPT4 [Brachionus plicatilis]